MELYFMADCGDYTPGYRNKALYRFRKKNNRHQPYFPSDDLVLIALYQNPISQDASRSESHIGPM